MQQPSAYRCKETHLAGDAKGTPPLAQVEAAARFVRPRGVASAIQHWGWPILRVVELALVALHAQALQAALVRSVITSIVPAMYCRLT